MITKKEQLKLISEQSGIPVTTVEKVYDAMGVVFVDIMMSGNACRMFNLGTLSHKDMKATAEITKYSSMLRRDVTTPACEAHNRPKFKFSTKLSDEMKQATLGNPFVD